MNEFLNPKSMLTPGVAGGLIMLLTNALCSYFPEIQPRYVAIILSFVIGALMLSASKMKAWERGAYWVVNSLIIFSMGVGATNIGANIADRQGSDSVISGIMAVFPGVAFAQSEKAQSPAAPDPKNQAPVTTGDNQPKPPSEDEYGERVETLEAEVIKLKAINTELLQQQSQAVGAPRSESAQTPKAMAPKKEPEGFFKRW